MKNYIEKKAKGLVKIVELNKSPALETKRFDPEYGTELPIETETVDINELTKRVSALEAELLDYRTILKDLNAKGLINRYL